jgi:peptide/nickel transport system substrate-binding protein
MAGAIGGMSMLAGCSGGGGTGNGNGNGNGNGDDAPENVTTAGGDLEPRDNSFANRTPDNPTNFQWNHYNFTTPIRHEMQTDMFQRYNIATDEYTPYALEIAEYAPQEERAVLEVREGLTWHNGDPGDPVNAEDLYAKFGCEMIVGNTPADFYDDLQVVGDRQLQLDLVGPISRSIFQESLNYYWVDTPRRLYREYVESYMDATTDDERSSVRNSLRNDSFDEPFGNGPFKFVERSSNRYRMEKYPHHPDADKINFQYWDLLRTSTDVSSVVLNMPNSDVEMVRNFNPPESVYQQRKDAHKINQLPALWGQSMPFNLDDDDVGNIRVRQAIAEFIDREEASRNYGRFGAAVQAPSGLVGNIAGDNSQSDRWTNWVTDDGAETLHRYNNPERGRRLLREEGYEKVDGQWQRPDGSPFELPIKVPADFSDWHPIFQTAVSNLKDEGIQASMQLIDSTAYWPDHYLASNFKAASTGWTLQNQHPYYTMGMYYRIDADFMNVDLDTLQAPPYGEPDGELQDVDVNGLMEDLRVATPEEEAEIIDQLAWIMNQTIPMLPLIEINDVIWMTDDDWTWDLADDDDRWQAKWPQWWFPRMGLMKAKAESS